MNCFFRASFLQFSWNRLDPIRFSVLFKYWWKVHYLMFTPCTLRSARRCWLRLPVAGFNSFKVSRYCLPYWFNNGLELISKVFDAKLPKVFAAIWAAFHWPNVMARRWKTHSHFHYVAVDESRRLSIVWLVETQQVSIWPTQFQRRTSGQSPFQSVQPVKPWKRSKTQ